MVAIHKNQDSKANSGQIRNLNLHDNSLFLRLKKFKRLKFESTLFFISFLFQP